MQKRVKKAAGYPSVRPLFLVAALLVLAGLGAKGWRIAQAAQSLLGRQAEIERLLANGVTNIEPVAAEALVLGVRQDVVTIRTEAAIFLPLLPYLEWLPRHGATLAATPTLLQLAEEGSATAVYVFRGLKPALTLLQDETPASSRLPELVTIVKTAHPDLVQANLAFERLLAARQTLGDGRDLNWRVQNLLTQVDPWLPIAHDGLQFALVLPQFLGSDGVRRYLLLAQNEDELRPTGGFITGAGMVVVENGRILDLHFDDANFLDNWQDKPYGDPPQPYRDFMQLDLFFFRDANYWPNFPTSAETAIRLYSYGQGVPEADGVIAFDQQFLRLLLQTTGPVTIEQHGVMLDAQNLIPTLQTAWGPPNGTYADEWIFDRKAFFSTFATAIRTRLEENFHTINPKTFAETMFQALQEKHLLLYSRDSAVSAVLQAVNWNGRLSPPTNQDFLAVIDTNVGYNKANLYIQRQIEVEIFLSERRSELTLLYENLASQDDTPCLQGVWYDDNPTYLEGANRCYWNYARVYTPDGAQLLESSQQTVPAENLYSGQTWQGTAEPIADLPGFTTFATLLLVPRSQQEMVSLVYQLPGSVLQSINDYWLYELQLVKQAGTPAQKWHITLHLPAEATLSQATPTPTAVSDQQLYFEFDLNMDTVIQIIYR